MIVAVNLHAAMRLPCMHSATRSLRSSGAWPPRGLGPVFREAFWSCRLEGYFRDPRLLIHPLDGVVVARKTNEDRGCVGAKTRAASIRKRISLTEE